MSTLLEPAFLRQLERLRVLTQRRFRVGLAGSRRSLRHGASVEFADHRAYAPGDDLRRIDWNVYARLEELVLRLYVAEQDLHVCLLVDQSASMGVGAPSKMDMARRLAAAIAYVGLVGNERIRVMAFDSRLHPAPPERGRGGVGRVFRVLEGLQASGTTELSAAVDALLARRMRPGLAVVISDFFDPSWIEGSEGASDRSRGSRRALDQLAAAGFEVSLLHVLAKEDVDPGEDSELEVVAAETGEQFAVALDGATRVAYLDSLSRLLENVAAYARSRAMRYLRVVGEEDFERTVLSFLGAEETPEGGAR